MGSIKHSTTGKKSRITNDKCAGRESHCIDQVGFQSGAIVRKLSWHGTNVSSACGFSPHGSSPFAVSFSVTTPHWLSRPVWQIYKRNKCFLNNTCKTMRLNNCCSFAPNCPGAPSSSYTGVGITHAKSGQGNSSVAAVLEGSRSREIAGAMGRMPPNLIICLRVEVC